MDKGRILQKIALAISPSAGERQKEKKIAGGIIARLSKFVPKGAKVALMGSVAKGTFLGDSKDVDIFILLPLSVPRADFEKIVKNSANRAFPKLKKELSYAEHPYVRVYLEGRRIDLVPAYAIKRPEERVSSVDRSFFHTKFVLRNLRKDRIPDVLLLKKFLKANGLYGAEIRVRGFSGYLCELFVIKYGNFMNAVREIAKWKAGVPPFIDITGYCKGKAETRAAIKRFGAQLVVIDPIDRNRNVAAAVSEENAKKLIALAKKFIKNPSEKMFLKPAPTFGQKIDEMRRKRGKTFTIALPSPAVVDDILWGQLRRLSDNLKSFLENYDFEVLETELDADKKTSKIAVRVGNPLLQKTKLAPGPELKPELKKNADEFRKVHARRHEKIIIRKKGKRKRLYALVKRKITDAGDAIKKFFAEGSIPSHFEHCRKSKK